MRAGRRTAVGAACGLLGLLGVAALVATVLGVRAVPVLTGSMTPHVRAGSLVLTTPLRPQDLRVGQVVAFRPPATYGTPDGRLVMHRVTGVAAPAAAGGPSSFTTRGDANPGPDPWHVALTPATQLGRERLAVPLLGRLLAGGRSAAVPFAAAAALLACAGALRRRPLPCGCPGRGAPGPVPADDVVPTG